MTVLGSYARCSGLVKSEKLRVVPLKVSTIRTVNGAGFVFEGLKDLLHTSE